MSGFSSYMRPNELFKLQATDLVPPQTCVDARLQHWGLLVSDRARCSQQDPGLRRISDARLHVDDMGWPLDRGSAPPAAEPSYLVFFDQLAHTNNFHSIAARANVAFLRVEPNSLRHSGASHDALTGHRNLALNKARKRWRADSSVQHHKKETRALQRIAMLDPTTVAYGQTIEKSLPTLFAQLTWTPMPPDVGLGRPHANKACEVPDNSVRSWNCPSPQADGPGGHAM